MARFRKGNFTTVPNREALRGKSPELQAVFFWLCDHSNDEGFCFPSYERLAECAGVHRTTVIKKIAELEELGLVVKTQRTSKNEHISNLYAVMELEGGSSPELPPSSPERLELNLLNQTDTPAVSVEIGISPSQSEFEDSADEETTYDYDCDMETGEPKRNGWGRTPKKKDAPKKRDTGWVEREDMLKTVEVAFGKRFLNREKQHSALKKILAGGITKEQVSKTIYEMIAKPWYIENGWDFSNVLSELSRK